jgi:hypothetical protein
LRPGVRFQNIADFNPSLMNNKQQSTGYDRPALARVGQIGALLRNGLPGHGKNVKVFTRQA